MEGEASLHPLGGLSPVHRWGTGLHPKRGSRIESPRRSSSRGRICYVLGSVLFGHIFMGFFEAEGQAGAQGVGNGSANPTTQCGHMTYHTEAVASLRYASKVV